MRKPHVCGYARRPPKCLKLRSNKQTNTYDITLREHTCMMSDFFGHFLLPSPLNVRFFWAILDPLPPKIEYRYAHYIRVIHNSHSTKF